VKKGTLSRGTLGVFSSSFKAISSTFGDAARSLRSG
jgi:hypothetical protein